MYKILVCGLTSNLGGIEKVILNFYEHMDKERFHLDFINLGEGKIGFSEKFEELSSHPVKYYNLPKRGKNPIEFKKKLEQVFKDHATEYDAVWVNISSLTNIEYLKLAKKYGIKRRIVHSHSSNESRRGIRYLLHKVNKSFIGYYATDFWACSDEAAKWFYPNKLMKEYQFIRNAIDSENFLFDEKIRGRLRKRIGLDEKDIVIGHVGLIHYAKNQEFAIEVFSEVIKLEPNVKLVLVGGGDNSKLKEQAKQLGIENKVLFLGLRDDVADLYHVFDFFFFPSRYEGFGVVLLEAQANGLPILTSDVITQQVIINHNLDTLPLSVGVDVWAERIKASLRNLKRVDKEEIVQNFSEKGFILQDETKRLEQLFLQGEK